jgi:hypothetical protein
MEGVGLVTTILAGGEEGAITGNKIFISNGSILVKFSYATNPNNAAPAGGLAILTMNTPHHHNRKL